MKRLVRRKHAPTLGFSHTESVVPREVVLGRALLGVGLSCALAGAVRDMLGSAMGVARQQRPTPRIDPSARRALASASGANSTPELIGSRLLLSYHHHRAVIGHSGTSPSFFHG